MKGMMSVPHLTEYVVRLLSFSPALDEQYGGNGAGMEKIFFPKSVFFFLLVGRAF